MSNWQILPLLLGHFLLNTLANICFKVSSEKSGARGFILWQAGGHLSGFGSVLVYTALLGFLPVSAVFPVTQGLSVLGVQLIAAHWIFKERILPWQWLGTGLVIAGIALISLP